MERHIIGLNIREFFICWNKTYSNLLPLLKRPSFLYFPGFPKRIGTVCVQQSRAKPQHCSATIWPQDMPERDNRTAVLLFLGFDMKSWLSVNCCKNSPEYFQHYSGIAFFEPTFATVPVFFFRWWSIENRLHALTLIIYLRIFLRMNKKI